MMLHTCRSVGRPLIDVSIDAILELRALNYKWTKIATLLNISRATLYRRLQDAGISTNDQTVLSDHQLDEIVRSIKVGHPNDEVLMRGHLLSIGVRVPRQALRNSIHRVDHVNTIARRQPVVRHRVYSVPYPNYIWHIDGNHKLIRWRFVIHGAIDGFSRTIMYLNCSNNNRATTVLDLFVNAVSQFSLPDRIRSDHGGENADLWRYMLASHNLDYCCVITGSSVHNEQVERLWRDVNRCISSSFSKCMRDLERNGLLDPLNETDVYCLHHIFLPRVNKYVTELNFKRHGTNMPCQVKEI